MRNILIDAGPLIALFAGDDKHHAHYDRLVSELSVDGLRLVTTWPCVVEASHLLDPPFRYELLEWIQLGGVAVYPFDVFHLKEIYKHEMDFADASLVWLANETGIEEIMTIDNKDFTRYRLPDGRALRLL